MLVSNKRRNDKYNLDDILNERYADCITEYDFYPPTDNRTVKSYVSDINGGDNFADYCKYMFDLLEEEGYYD
jgi:hypothetical protein